MVLEFVEPVEPFDDVVELVLSLLSLEVGFFVGSAASGFGVALLSGFFVAVGVSGFSVAADDVGAAVDAAPRLTVNVTRLPDGTLLPALGYCS